MCRPQYDAHFRITMGLSTAQRTATSVTMQAMQLQDGSVLSRTVFVLAAKASKLPNKSTKEAQSQPLKLQ